MVNVLGESSIQLDKTLVDLINQQEWLWGQDIISDHGNLLIAYEFDRLGTSQDRFYHFSGDIGDIYIWGSGIIFMPAKLQSGIFLRRYEPDVYRSFCDPDNLCGYRGSQFHLARCDDSESEPLVYFSLGMLFTFIAEYETWVYSNYPDHRDAAANSWKEQVCQGCEICDIWMRTAQQYIQKYECHTESV